MRRTILPLALLAGFIGLVIGFGQGTAQAQAGVGVNVGSIRVDEGLAPGHGYNLPPVGVINTGHVLGDYGLRIVYRHEQAELRPPKEWFNFHPDLLHLEPGEMRDVDIGLNLPATARPGDYFAFVEAYRAPSEKEIHGGLMIQIAAATKLYFKVVTPKCDDEFE